MKGKLTLETIAIFQTDLCVGGIQKSLINFLNNIDVDKFKIDVYLFNKEVFYDFTPRKNIKIIFLKSLPYSNKLIYFSILNKFVRRYAIKKNYDYAIDFNSYSNECALSVIQCNAKKKIMWIHNDISVKKREEIKYRVLFHFFKPKLKKYDMFAAVSSGIIEPFKKEAGIYDKAIYTIPNFIDAEEIIKKSEEKIDFSVDSNVYNLVSMGRLCHQKGFDLLLNIFADVLEKRKNIHLYIIGDGPDRENLEKQANNLGIKDKISFLGNKKNPFPYLKLMDGFVLSSRYEGQGMVFWEAKALGLPIYMPKRLEKYNDGLTGYEDLEKALVEAKKTIKTIDDLNEYSSNINEQLEKLLS